MGGGDAAALRRDSLLRTQAGLDGAADEYTRYRAAVEARVATYGDPEAVGAAAVVTVEEDEAVRAEALVTRGFARHVFNDLDDDGSGKVDARELRRLAALLGERWDDARREEVLKAADRDGDGGVCFDELYLWLRENTASLERADLFRHTPGPMLDTLRPEWAAALRVMEMGDEHRARAAATHGATLVGHLSSVYSTLREWGNAEHVCVAGLFHSAYDAAPAHTALRPREDRGVLARLLGEEAEELAWYFDSANKITPDGAGGAGMWDAPPHAPCARVIDPAPARGAGDAGGDGWARIPRATRGRLAELCLANLFDAAQAEGAEWYAGYVAVRFADVAPLLSGPARGVVERCALRAPRLPFAAWGAQCPAVLKWRHLARHGRTAERRRRADDSAALLERRYEDLAAAWIGA